MGLILENVFLSESGRIMCMKFRSLIIKNIFRNKSRSLLAKVGIAIGAATILGLGLVTDGLAASTQQALTAGAADFTVLPSSLIRV